MRILYRALYAIALALTRAWRPLSGKARAWLDGRRDLIPRLSIHCSVWREAPFWFHVASSGELEQCLPILDAIKRLSPSQRIFLSYFSPTARHALALEIERRSCSLAPPSWDGADFSPFDRLRDANAFLDAVKPSQFVAIHREIWPVLVERALERNIPCHLFAASVSGALRQTLWLYRPLLRRFKSIAAVDPGAAQYFQGQFPDVSVHALGDPRVDRVFSRLEKCQSAPWMTPLKDHRVFVAASIWPSDFSYLERTLVFLLTQQPEWRIVVVPHEPSETFIVQLSRWFKKLNAPCQRWSHWSRAPRSDTHLIVDGVGWLLELYRVATLVYVGGSSTRQVHSVLEPAGHGKAILTGPRIENSPQAIQMASLPRGLIKTQDGQELLDRVETLCNDPLLREEHARSVKEHLDRQRGAPERYARLLLDSV